MNTEPNSSPEPVYADHAIRCGSEVYPIQLETLYETKNYSKKMPLVEAEPGEVPRRVMNGFVYGGRVFVPPYESGPNWSRTNDHARDMRELDKVRRRDAAQARSIPVELEREVYERSRTQSSRVIALWLTREKSCPTTYASVGRLVRRLTLREYTLRQRNELEEEVRDLRVRLNQTLETLMDLQADMLEEHDGLQKTTSEYRLRAKPQRLPVVWQAHQQTAVLLERRLRAGERDLITLQRQCSTVNSPEASAPPQAAVPAAKVEATPKASPVPVGNAVPPSTTPVAQRKSGPARVLLNLDAMYP